MEASLSVVSPVKKGRARLVVLPGGARAARADGQESEAGASSGLALAASDHASAASRIVAPAEVDEARPPRPSVDDEIFDRIEVPAAVVCARCGEADCLGCDPDEERSGFLTIVPWERPDTSAVQRFLLTARLATERPESFFEALPDGHVGSALRFALLAELTAALALLAFGAGALAIAFPSLSSHVLSGPGATTFVLRAVVVGLPTVAAILVGAHVVHALAIDWAARKAGARGQRSRALRFGLYAAGWDVMLGPVGLVVITLSAGPRALVGLLRAGSDVPRRATMAFLRGAYAIGGEPAKIALKRSYVGAGVATLIAALLFFGLGAAFLIALVSL